MTDIKLRWRTVRHHSKYCRCKLAALKGDIDTAWGVIGDSYKSLPVGRGTSAFVIFQCNDPSCHGLLGVRLDDITKLLPRR